MARNGRMSANAVELALSQLGADVTNKALATLRTGGEMILADAKARIHSISGALSASGKLQVNKNGTIIKIVFDAKSTATAHTAGGYGYSKIVAFRPGHEHPYLYPAYDAHRDQVKADVIETIRQAVAAHAVP